MIEVVAAQEILVGFALAAVLRDDQAGRAFEHFGGARDRPRSDFLASDRDFARRFRRRRGGAGGGCCGRCFGRLRRGGGRAGGLARRGDLTLGAPPHRPRPRGSFDNHLRQRLHFASLVRCRLADGLAPQGRAGRDAHGGQQPRAQMRSADPFASAKRNVHAHKKLRRCARVNAHLQGRYRYDEVNKTSYFWYDVLPRRSSVVAFRSAGRRLNPV